MIRVITLKLDEARASFDEAALLTAQEKKAVVKWDWQVVENGNGGRPLVVVVMETVPNRASSTTATEVKASEGSKGSKRRKGAYKDVVPDDRWELFHLLRDWRNSRAKKDGVPPYVILTNMELARVCRKLPLSLSQLGDVRGIGNAKLKKYGSEIIDRVARWRSRTAADEVRAETAPARVKAPDDGHDDADGTEAGTETETEAETEDGPDD